MASGHSAHTWQIEPQNMEYTGAAWYRRPLYVPASWAGHVI